MRILGLIVCVGAVSLFYWAFFRLAPGIAALIPQGAYAGLLKVVVYGVIAYFGGIGLPFVLLIIGIGLLAGIWGK